MQRALQFMLRKMYSYSNFMPSIINNGLDIISTICCDVNLQTRHVQGVESGLQFPFNTRPCEDHK